MAYLAPVTAPPAVTLHPILADDAERVSRFLHEHLNPRVSPSAWRHAILTTWPGIEPPNHGFMLVSGTSVVGANLAFYSSRQIDGSTRRVCNLAALCVKDEFRAQTLRLIRALLKQQNYTFTDLSPSGNVITIDERLGFERLDTTTLARPNLVGFGRSDATVVTEVGEIEGLLTGEDLRVFLDHRDCAAARHVVLQAAGRRCYVIFRIDKRKRLRTFASLLHVSDPGLYLTYGAVLGPYFVRRHRALVTLVESRLLGGAEPHSRMWRRLAGRPKMFKSGQLVASQIDYLYSELTCVDW